MSPNFTSNAKEIKVNLTELINFYFQLFQGDKSELIH